MSCLLCCRLSTPPLSYLSYTHLSILGLAAFTRCKLHVNMIRTPSNHFPVKLHDNGITPSDSVRNLGVIFDSDFSFHKHVSNICKSCFYHTRAEPVPVCICPLAKPVPVCIYRDPNTKGNLSAKHQFCAIDTADDTITDSNVRMVRPIFRRLFTVSSLG